MSDSAVQDGKLTVTRSERRVDVKMLSDPTLLRPLRLELEELGRASGLKDSQSDEIGLVLNEALANVMRHAYGGAKDKPIEIVFERRGDGADTELEIRIRDWGKTFDPAKLPGDPPPPDPDTIKPGGLGLLCMRKLMNKVEFTRCADGMLLTMTKKIGK